MTSVSFLVLETVKENTERSREKFGRVWRRITIYMWIKYNRSPWFPCLSSPSKAEKSFLLIVSINRSFFCRFVETRVHWESTVKSHLLHVEKKVIVTKRKKIENLSCKKTGVAYAIPRVPVMGNCWIYSYYVKCGINATDSTLPPDTSLDV